MPFTDVPPSYDSSISRETWTIIAPYIPSADLCACCLVSRKWHATFIPFLWGDPASHFGIANDAVYVALTRFKKVLRKVRPSVRALTHTLHLPPALSEIYGGPHATWLRDVLEYLPNLQSLIVAKLPFFDHHALNVLRTTTYPRRGSEDQEIEVPTYGLKLLLAGSEPNTTSQGLSTALPRFPFLVYLDLSYTKPARDPSALYALSALHDLQVLKLRGIGLRDGEAEVLANAIGIRVRLLDVRDNLLTDMAVRSLMQACFFPRDKLPESSQNNARRIEDWPVGMAPGPDYFSLDMLRGEELDHELLKQLTNPLTGRLAFEDIPHRGLTHLYISDNHLSVEGLSSLLKSERLHILDGGSVDTVKTITRTRSPYSATGYVDEVKFPGAEKLIPVLAQAASKNLTYLRVDHAIITASLAPPSKVPTAVSIPRASTSVSELASDTSSLRAELPSEAAQINELSAPAHYPVEMPTSGDAVFEMDATPAAPKYELPGDMIYFAVSPPIGDAPGQAAGMDEVIEGPIRGEGAYAPEVVVDEPESPNGHGEAAEAEVVLNATGFVTAAQPAQALQEGDVSSESGAGTNSTTRSIMSPVSPVTPAARAAKPQTASSHIRPTPKTNGQTRPGKQQLQNGQSSSSFRQARIDFLLKKRPHPLSSIKPTSNSTHPELPRSALALLTRLHPCLLPNLRTLVITNVPVSIPVSSPALDALKVFISACASESTLSHLLAAIDYSLPPGRARHRAEQEAARRLFALKTIVLEMEQPNQVAKNQSGHRAWEHTRQRLSMSKSSTGDHDSENLWSAAADDFSFFAEEGGEEEDECGIYQHEQDKYFPTAAMSDEKMFLGPGEEPEPPMFRRFDGTANGTSSASSSMYEGRTLSPSTAAFGGRPTPTLRSPRHLPLGRNRRASNEAQRGASNSITAFDGRPSTPELMGSAPLPPPPTSNPVGSPPRRMPSLTQRQQSQFEAAEEEEEEEHIDLVSALASWRKERKAAFETAMRQFRSFRPSGDNEADGDAVGNFVGEVLPPFIEGYWKGEIKVIRNAAPKGRSGVVDMYGNYFEKGYLYP